MNGLNKQFSYRESTLSDLDGDYLDNRQYLIIAVSLGVTHLILEALYIYLGCTPMAFINIASIVTYIVSIILILKNRTTSSVFTMELEIYFHVIFASIFLGLECGFQLWLFGAASSIFLPFFMPGISRGTKRQIAFFVVMVIVGFETLTFLENHGYLPTKYRVDGFLAEVMFHVNAALGFGSVMVYSSLYNNTMAARNQELQWVADHDGLTGIFSRQKIQNIIVEEYERSRSLQKNDLAIAILDVDFFKNINDTHGHAAGDEVLKEMARMFRDAKRKGLLYGRWGGEEFLLIAPASFTYEQFGKMLEDLRLEVENHVFMAGGCEAKITVSIGAAILEDGMTETMLVKAADDRLYAAKEAGRNKVVLH